MISNITASTIYSTLGNNSSKVPLAIKDIANSCGLTTASYLAGDEVEGKDRFIDEFGTQAVWLWGIPAYQKLLDVALFKPMKLDPKVDARVLKDPKIFELAIENAPTQSIKNSLENVAKHQAKFKGLTMAKFAISTILTSVTYFGLTKFRHRYTEDQIKKDYFEKQKSKDVTFTKASTQQIPFSSAFSAVHTDKSVKKDQNVSFTGGLQDFVFDPVKNLMLVDASITGERLLNARNPQDFLGYAIKEASFWSFMYFAGPIISKALEKHADKMGKPIDLDARVIESKELADALKNRKLLDKHLKTFEAADVSDVNMYKFAVNPKSDNIIIDFAKKSDFITMVKGSDKVDTRKYIDLSELRKLKGKLENLINKCDASGMSADDFLKSVKKAKRAAVLGNIGACIAALGVIAPAIMLVSRKNDKGYQVKNDIEKKLANKTA